MEDISFINNTSVYRNPAPQSPLQGANVMQPAAVYSKIMLRTIELAESDYVFDSLAVERTMPSNNGSNEIVFKRMLSLAAHTQPLVEGIPPASDQGRMVAIKASTKSYGRVMKFTDKVNWAVVDPLISEYTRQLSLKIPETKDILAQEALLAEAQTFYASKKERGESDSDHLTPVAGGDVTHIKFMHPDCAPTIDEFRKIVLSMEAAKVRPYQGSNFLTLATSAVLFDLITDKRVKEFMKYTSTGSAYSNDMVIDLFSLAFKKAKTAKSDNTYIDADGNTVHIYHSVTEKANYLLLSPVTGRTYSVADNGEKKIDLETKKVTELTKGTALATDLEPLNIHYSYILGEDCLYRIGVEGHTAPQFIKKELGSAGTEDPLNQRQSIGWKIDSLGYKVPNPDAVVVYLSCPTQYKINTNARPDLKNQFTDYFYGYVDAEGRYWYPEQVMQTVVNGAVKYYVKGTTTEVTAIKMSKLVKPVNGGRILESGKKAEIVGDVPTKAFALVGNPTIRFTEDQVISGKEVVEAGGSLPYGLGEDTYYIKGIAASSATLLVQLPVVNGSQLIVGENVNATGDPRIDK